VISSDLLNPFQGLQFLNEPFAEPIAGTVTVADVPEPATLVISGAVLAALGILRRRERGGNGSRLDFAHRRSQKRTRVSR
jgi:hypothetical protein